jgi:hypothetical protein
MSHSCHICFVRVDVVDGVIHQWFSSRAQEKIRAIYILVGGIVVLKWLLLWTLVLELFKVVRPHEHEQPPQWWLAT